MVLLIGQSGSELIGYSPNIQWRGWVKEYDFPILTALTTTCWYAGVRLAQAADFWHKPPTGHYR